MADHPGPDVACPTCDHDPHEGVVCIMAECSCEETRPATRPQCVQLHPETGDPCNRFPHPRGGHVTMGGLEWGAPAREAPAAPMRPAPTAARIAESLASIAGTELQIASRFDPADGVPILLRGLEATARAHRVGRMWFAGPKPKPLVPFDLNELCADAVIHLIPAIMKRLNIQIVECSPCSPIGDREDCPDCDGHGVMLA